MILTEDRDYVLSLELEDCGSVTGLANKMVELEFTNKELLHAVITCGMPIQRLRPAYMNTRRAEILYKIFLVETALEVKGDRLQKSRRTAYLDSSEKSVISYYLGMFFTKLISRKLFAVDYLTHLNTIEKAHGEGFIDYFDNEWRPDMIGYCRAKDSWSVWEAKGGSNKRVQALEKGSKQVAAIAAVNGQKPSPAAVCMTYYDHGYLCAIVRDPESIEGEQLDIREEHFYRAYYRPVLEAFQEQGMRMNGRDMEIGLRIPHFAEEGRGERELHIGMPQELLQYIAGENYGMLRELLYMPKEEYADNRYAGADGIYIR
ncbi:MAG: hypothetical protein Q4C61_06450 [Lachnospiraceae bacterium]|nr:hypothetical protein [Lachnospiraceae bacterium]